MKKVPLYNRRYQAGDTIVEVMIALAVISTVIALSYATASRALNTGRQAQERTEALKYAEGQIEMLKDRSRTDSVENGMQTPGLIYYWGYDRVPLVAIGTPESFCLGNGVLYPQAMIATDLDADGLSYNPAVGGGSTPAYTYHNKCAVGTDSRYKLSIERDTLSISGSLVSTFTVRVRWERLGGGKDELRLDYRQHWGQF